MKFVQFEIGEIKNEQNFPKTSNYDWRDGDKAKETLNRMLEKRRAFRKLNEGV